ncbi:glycosyltransferase family 39 protein [Herbiconiux moechotypicola]|uniref:Glycosyltransferase family 39 protein n=1 Tax=Herbiconiux moechotypicola TaxID=637393 RepID=A0ABN3E4Y4_9MICO|nr:glycosyltransferase family 39 protein [Herbiconiux moechotypicola]MCS5731799.1 glycosyltransferase family 39 protein [Herbiconiux moechotypicola]
MTGVATGAPAGSRILPRFARLPVLSAAGALALVLALTAGGYGYHRDELYFRMLEPAWGYLDQPPLTPLLAKLSTLIADEPWALRLWPLLFAVASVAVVALLARELGGGAFAQGLAAWGYAFGSFTLTFGHALFTASLDLLVWPLVVLAVLRALRGWPEPAQPWWWLVAGAIVGLSLDNKLLVALLLLSLAAGILVAGPRGVLRTRWPYLGVAVMFVLGAPALVYQALNGWPQLAMGGALSSGNAGEVRVLMWPFLALLLGPLLVPIWVAGLVGLLRRAAWRSARFLAVAFGVLLVLVAIAGAQFYYPYGLLVCVYAAGCVVVADWAGSWPGRRLRRVLLVAAVAVNSVVSAVISLPIVPVDVLGATPIPAMNQSVADQVGWPAYVAQVERAALDSGADVVIASNYGEAGALDRYGGDALPPVVSGHNALAAARRPAADAEAAVVVGGQFERVRDLFARCAVVDELDSGLGVDNEEQGEPMAVCSGPVRPWAELWPSFAHLN